MIPALLERQLQLWPGLDGGRAALINLSENHTFRIDTPDGGQHIIRVHRPNYQSKQAIHNELTWLEAIRGDTSIPVVKPMRGTDGEMVQSLEIDAQGTQTFAVRFQFEKGEIAETLTDLSGFFGELGHIAAHCHTHAQFWEKPINFHRPVWNVDAILNPDGLWGDWRQAPQVTGEVAETLAQLDQRLRMDFAAYGTGPDRFGLIHADMRLANLLVDGSAVRLIDFDDCGFGWFAYDFAAGVSFFEDSPEIPLLKAQWLASYRKIRHFSAEDEHMLDAAILLRRMALLAWIGSHNEVDLAKHHAPDFARNSAKLAKAYLASQT